MHVIWNAHTAFLLCGAAGAGVWVSTGIALFFQVKYSSYNKIQDLKELVPHSPTFFQTYMESLVPEIESHNLEGFMCEVACTKPV